MIFIEVPGTGNLLLDHLVLDYNGTLALDGEMITGVRKRVEALAKYLEVHVVTADTFGQARQQLQGLPVTLHILHAGDEPRQKQDYVEKLKSITTAAIGNGCNDSAMLEAAVLGICILGPEGCAFKTMAASNLMVRDIREGLDLFLNPKRLKASLRE